MLAIRDGVRGGARGVPNLLFRNEPRWNLTTASPWSIPVGISEILHRLSCPNPSVLGRQHRRFGSSGLSRFSPTTETVWDDDASKLPPGS